MFAKLKEIIEEWIRERQRKEAEKKLKKLIARILCAAVLCFVGVMLFKHRKPILAAIIGKKLLAEETCTCPAKCSVFSLLKKVF